MHLVGHDQRQDKIKQDRASPSQESGNNKYDAYNCRIPAEIFSYSTANSCDHFVGVGFFKSGAHKIVVIELVLAQFHVFLTKCWMQCFKFFGYSGKMTVQSNIPETKKSCRSVKQAIHRTGKAA